MPPLLSSFRRLVPLLLAGLSARRIAVDATLVTEDLQLVWHDEFNGGSVDWDKWVVDEGDGCDVDLCDWGNGEKQYYLSENAAVANGVLAITAKKEDYSSRFYTSSKVTTKNKFSFRYGRAEARLRLPPGGQGLWPAFWMMPQDNAYGKWAASGEIDIFESRNNFTEAVNNLAYGNAFPNNSNHNGECFLDVPDGTLEEYHVYAVEWDADEMVWFMDDEETCRIDDWFSTDVKTGEVLQKPAPFDQDFYLVLNMAVGGNDEFVGSGPIDDTVLPAVMEIDFVRVYQSPEMTGDDDDGEAEGSRSVYLRDATGGGSRQGVEIWGDEFNSSEVSGDWEIASGEVCLGALCTNEVQVFNGSAVSVEGGVLRVTAASDATASGADGGIVAAATSGLLHTMDSFSLTYGRLEANISAPAVAGVVSAVSLLTADIGDDDSTFGQVDVVVVENGVAVGGAWYPGGNTSCAFSKIDYDLDASLYHVFAVEWTDDRLRWYAGTRQYCEVTSLDVEEAGGSWPFGEEMYVAVGVTVGRGVLGGEEPVNASSLPATLSVGQISAHQFTDMEASLEQAASAIPTYQQEGNLTWQDEFDGIELDAASQEAAGEGAMGLEYWWQHEEGDGCEMDICGFGNGEAQWYRKENVVIRDGKLSITAKAEAYAGNIYTSAKLSTGTMVSITYGRIEIRVKLPKAQGLWPSIWMLPQDSPYGGWASGGAINILEARNEMSRVHGQLAFGGAYPDVEKLDLSEGGHCYSDLHDDLSEDYHVYALEWETDSFRWYLDGVLYCDRHYWYSRPGPGEEDYPFPAPFDTSFYLIMNVAVGGDFTGGLIDEDALGENPEMLVDYVRVYQVEGQSISIAEPPEVDSSNGGGSPLSVVTALSVLVVLGVLFSLCLMINCIAKRKSKRAARAAALGLDGAGGGVAGAAGGRSGRLSSTAYEAFSSEKTDISLGLAAANGASSGGNHGNKPAKFLLGGGGGGLGQGQVANASAADGGRDKGVVDGDSLPGLPSPSYRGGAAAASAGGGGLRGGSVGARRGGAPDAGGQTESPMWGRRAGADENRADVTPSRFRQNGGGGAIVGGGVAGTPATRTKLPRPPSGSIPEDWAAEAAAERGSRRSGRGGGTDAAGADGDSISISISSSSPVRVSSVDMVIEEAIAMSATASSAHDQGGFFPDETGSCRGDEDVWMGGGSTVGSTSAAAAAATTPRSAAGVGQAAGLGYIGDYGMSSSVGSEESEMPPSMPGLRLDRRTIDQENVTLTGLPSYEEVVGVA